MFLVSFKRWVKFGQKEFLTFEFFFLRKEKKFYLVNSKLDFAVTGFPSGEIRGPGFAAADEVH